MMPLENRPVHIVKLLPAGLTLITLSIAVAVMIASFLDLHRITFRAANSLRPAQLVHHFITLRIVNQLLNRYHARILLLHCFLSHLLETT